MSQLQIFINQHRLVIDIYGFQNYIGVDVLYI